MDKASLSIKKTMDKAYDHKKVEDEIYKIWEEKGYFKPEVNPDGKPYSIILPPPNANGALHFGHAMYVIEDILVRYHRMKGCKTLWLPGADHAGFETQFVFEKKLAEQGKSRLDFDRDTLYQMIWDYVQENRGGMETQLKKLGFSLDWSRLKFTLDPDIVKIVYQTFKELYDQGLVYRDYRLVNYCTYDGTSFSDLEVVNIEGEGTLYEIAYPLTNGDEIIVATTRPETLFGDKAVMINPHDAKYKDLAAKGVFAILPLMKDQHIPIIEDESVDMEFGTGAVKVTPLHDFNDADVAKRHNITNATQIINFDGKMINTGVVDGLYVKQARQKTIELLKEAQLLRGEKKYQATKKTCYKCKNVLEPLPLEQWFVKMEELAKAAVDAVKTGKTKIHPENFEKVYFQFLENIRDWNISRQVVWGIRIPAWKCEDCDAWIVTDGEIPKQCDACKSLKLTQDNDTFDTWFSSGQWPFATLKASHVKTDFETFYPTTVMETGYDILRWWVARMMMLGLYAENKVPFQHVVLHGLVLDPLGKKMSKSKGNVVNPMELVDQYGTDAVRFALVYGTGPGNDQLLSYPKLEAARKFANKLWNIGRFIEMKRAQTKFLTVIPKTIEEFNQMELHQSDREQVEYHKNLAQDISKHIENYQFNLVAEKLYDSIWHNFADKYVEDVKVRIDQDFDLVKNPNSMIVLESLYFILLKLLHPFMPFVTEEIAKELKLSSKMLIISEWPQK